MGVGAGVGASRWRLEEGPVYGNLEQRAFLLAFRGDFGKVVSLSNELVN